MPREFQFDGFLSGDLRSIAGLTMQDAYSGTMLVPFDPGIGMGRVVAWEIGEAGLYYREDHGLDASAVEAIMWKKYQSKSIAGYEILQPGGMPVGYIDMLHMGGFGKSAIMGVIIGQKEVWGQGVGTTAATMLMLCARNIGLQYIYGHINPANNRAAGLMDHFPHVAVRDEKKNIDIYRISLASVNFQGIRLVGSVG